MDNELDARIRTLRKERGLSQEALAQALEVSRQAVTKWEDGSSLPSTANLFALSGFFGVPLAELTGTPDGNAPASISEKTRDKRTKTLRIGAWVLLAVSVWSSIRNLRWCRASAQRKMYFSETRRSPVRSATSKIAKRVRRKYLMTFR